MQNRKKGMRVAVGAVLTLLLAALVAGGALLASLGSRGDLLPVGRDAPDFTSGASDGATLRLSELRGEKRVVLVFYPGDRTPVCTAQLCRFRDHWGALRAEGAVVYGVNTASRESHAGFAAENRLPFPLLADVGGAIAADYGCRAVFGIVKRTVYVIDRRGRVAWARRGDPAPAEVLRVLRGLKDGPAGDTSASRQRR